MVCKEFLPYKNNLCQKIDREAFKHLLSEHLKVAGRENIFGQIHHNTLGENCLQFRIINPSFYTIAVYSAEQFTPHGPWDQMHPTGLFQLVSLTVLKL